MTEVAAGPKDSYPARWGPAGGLTLAVIRHGAETRRQEDLAGIARAAAAAEKARHSPELPTRSSTAIFMRGISLQAAIGLPGDAARQHITEPPSSWIAPAARYVTMY